MATFEIGEKEYELKLNYASIKRLNSAFEGGSYELIGKAISGDFEAFPIIVQAALIHTGENFTKKAVEEAIEQAIDGEKLTMEDVSIISDAVVTDSFFYKPTVAKMMKNNPEMKAALEQLRG